jgi:hypothetical protein
MKLSAYELRLFARARHMGCASNVAAPACECRNLRQRVLPGQCQRPVNFGLAHTHIPGAERKECRRKMPARVSFGLCRVRRLATNWTVHVDNLGSGYDPCNHPEIFHMKQRLIRDCSNREQQ